MLDLELEMGLPNVDVCVAKKLIIIVVAELCLIVSPSA